MGRIATGQELSDIRKEYYDRRSGLHVDSEAYSVAIRMHDMAMAYVWGWQDATTGDTDSTTALTFAAAYGLHAIDFEVGDIYMRRPIIDAFRRWNAGKPIAAQVTA